MWISTGLCRALYTKHKYVWPYSSWPWPALIKLSCTAPLNAPTLLPLSIFLVLLSPIHLFLTFPCLHSRWWGSLSFPSLTCPRHLVYTMLWLVKGGGGVASSFHHSKSSSSWAPECLLEGQNLLYVLSLYTAFMVKTGTQQRQNKGPWGGGLGVGRGDISLLSYDSSNSTSGMMLQSLGKPSAKQEDDSIKVFGWKVEVWELSKGEGGWGGPPVYCVLLQCDSGFM